MWILNLGKPDTVPSLNEQAAIELGANLLGEGIIFVIAAAIIYLEYARQVRKEAAKEAQKKDELDLISYTIRDLAFRVEGQEAEIRHLTNMVASLDSRVMKIPWKSFSINSKPEEAVSTSPNRSTNVNSKQTDSIVEAIGYISEELMDNNNNRQR